MSTQRKNCGVGTGCKTVERGGRESSSKPTFETGSGDLRERSRERKREKKKKKKKKKY